MRQFCFFVFVSLVLWFGNLPTVDAVGSCASNVVLLGDRISVVVNLELWGNDQAVLDQVRSDLEVAETEILNNHGQGNLYKCYQLNFALSLSTRLVTEMTDELTDQFLDESQNVHRVMILDVTSDSSKLEAYQNTGLYDLVATDGHDVEDFYDEHEECYFENNLTYTVECANAYHEYQQSHSIPAKTLGWANLGDTSSGSGCYDGGYAVLTNANSNVLVHEILHLLGYHHNEDIGAEGTSIMNALYSSDDDVSLENQQDFLSSMNLECRWDIELGDLSASVQNLDCFHFTEYPVITAWSESADMHVHLQSQGLELSGDATLVTSSLNYQTLIGYEVSQSLNLSCDDYLTTGQYRLRGNLETKAALAGEETGWIGAEGMKVHISQTQVPYEASFNCYDESSVPSTDPAVEYLRNFWVSEDQLRGFLQEETYLFDDGIDLRFEQPSAPESVRVMDFTPGSDMVYSNSSTEDLRYDEYLSCMNPMTGLPAKPAVQFYYPTVTVTATPLTGE